MQRPKVPAPLVEGVDYYMEGGKFVFTAKYHLKRGYCCNSRCRHCPYGNSPPPLGPRLIGAPGGPEPHPAPDPSPLARGHVADPVVIQGAPVKPKP